MITVTLCAVLVTLVILLGRAIFGPTAFDRLLAANAIGTCAVLILTIYGFFSGRPDFLDLALVYGLLNIIGVIAVLKFFRYGDLGASHPDRSPEENSEA